MPPGQLVVLKYRTHKPNIFIDKDRTKKRPFVSMLNKFREVQSNNNDFVATAAGGARKSASPDSVADSLFEGGSLPASSMGGTPSAQALSMEAEKLAEQERRQLSHQQERKRQWQRWKESLKSSDDEQLQTPTQVSRAEENKRRRLGDDFHLQRRAPTAPMTEPAPRPAVSTNSPGLFVGQSRSESLESGEIAEPSKSTGKTNSRISLPGRAVLSTATTESAVPRSPTGIQIAPTANGAADDKLQEIPRWPQRPFWRASSSELSDMSDEPDSGVPARRSEPSIINYQPKFAKRPLTTSVAPKQPESSVATAQAKPGGQNQADEQTIRSESVSQDARPDVTMEGTETQRIQEIVNNINAEQEAADPDFDPAVASNSGAGRGVALSRPRRTLSGTRHELTDDVVMREAASETPANSNVVTPTRPPAPPPSSSMKSGEAQRPRDAGWKFESLRPPGKRERDSIIKEIGKDWGCPLGSVVPRDLWPRSTDGVELPKQPRNWSQDLLRTLRGLSMTTSGDPQLAKRVLREAVKQQVARHGGHPFLCKEDVKFAEELLRNGFGKVEQSAAPVTTAEHNEVTVGSSRPPIQNSTADDSHITRSDSHQPSAPGSRGGVPIRINSTPPRETHISPVKSAAKRVSDLLDTALEPNVEPENNDPEELVQEGVLQGERDLRSSLSSSQRQVTPQTASTNQRSETRPLTKQQKLLIEEYKLARLRRDLLANDIDPDSI